jgi:hypothetical protein
VRLSTTSTTVGGIFMVNLLGAPVAISFSRNAFASSTDSNSARTKMSFGLSTPRLMV